MLYKDEVHNQFLPDASESTADGPKTEKMPSGGTDPVKLQTNWRSMWISISLQFLVGVQISVYYMSMWPYLSGLDKTADVDFLGWVVASCSIGCTIANPIYGFWNQKTMSVRWPLIAGFAISAIGQVWYAILPFFSTNAKWHMMISRFITGLGIGNIAVLRVHAAMASTIDDRMKAISLGTGGFVLGISFGPVISAFFTPLGEIGWHLGIIRLNMYTVVAFLMSVVLVLACVFVYVFFEECFVGIISKEEKDSENGVIVPKFDRAGALICIYLFMVVSMIATNIEVMSTPLSTAFYNWKDSDSILYNGIALFLSCVVTVSGNVTMGMTKLGHTDKRHQMLLGIVFFLLYQVFMYPWGFYSGPLDYIPEGMNTTVIGGCDIAFKWCATTTRVPLSVYLFCFIVFFGIAFPLIEAPSAALYSEILGPRKQGAMQGLFSLGGSISPVIASISSTALFQHTGYRYVVVLQTVILLAGAVLIFAFYKSLVPLKVIQKSESTASKL